MASTATLITQLKERRDAVILEINGLGATKPGGNPDATGPGVNVKHQDYKTKLYEELNLINEQLNQLDIGVVEHEGY